MQFSPLPNIKDFFSVFNRNINNKLEILKPWIKKGDIAGWLSKSSWSFVLITLWKRNFSKKNKKLNIWVPEFFCNSSLELLRKTDENIIFYKIKKNMEPDYSYFGEISLKSPPDIFILVHYFGKSFDSARAKQFCSGFNSWLIEDAVHVVFPNKSIGKFGDFVLYSPHKTLPIPNGSILIIKKNGPGLLNCKYNDLMYNPIRWVETLNKFIRYKNIKLQSSFISLTIWFTKRLLQKLGFNKSVFLDFKEKKFNSKNNSQYFISPKISNLSIKILKNHINDIFEINFKRLKNHKIWSYFILKNYSNKLDVNLLTDDNQDINYIPYLSSFKFQKRFVEDVFKELQNKKIKVTTWPDLPPEVIKNKKTHENAWKLRHSYFYLPCHQSITPISFKNILKENNIKKSNNNIFYEVNKISRYEWNNLLNIVTNSNLLQSWTYGDAKSKEDGWMLKRLVFKKRNNPLAIVNLLEKKILGIKIFRINRGPLFIPSIKSQEKNIIIKKILDFGNISKMSLLSINLELNLNGKNLSFLIRNNVKIFKTKTWSSSLLNLSFDNDRLKANLNSTWRYNLNSSQKNNLTIEYESNDEFMNWIIKKYSLNMKLKKFNGISISVFKNLYKNMQDDCRIIVFKVKENGISVSGSCFALHGNSATYLLGWTGNRGRDLKANHFQIWNAINILKKMNIKWLDLGGIDKADSKGISEFKLGMRGENYNLVGEGWKWN